MTTSSGVRVPPHVMLFVPDETALKGFPSSARTGTPWTMMANTVYDHLIIPTGTNTRGDR